MLKVIWLILKVWVRHKIWFPIMARWNYIVYGAYMPDNMRNRALLEFCEKVMADPEYKPEGIYENMFEDRLHEVYDQVIDYCKKTKPEEFEDLKGADYAAERPYCAAQIHENMLQLLWIED